MKRELLNATRQRVEVRSNALAGAVQSWLQRYTAEVLRTAGVRKGRAIRKADDAGAEGQLAELLARFGLSQAADAQGRAVELVRRRTSLGTLRLSDFSGLSDEIAEHAAAIGQDVRDTVLERISAIVDDAQHEDPPVTQAEVARRIRADIGDSDVFSFERAMRISRTELAVSENTGLVQGYKAAGIAEIEWLGYRAPKFARRHDLMIGERAEVDGGTFELPSGVVVRYPGDPRAPVGEIVHCRCSTAPVIVPASTKRRLVRAI
jgi:hypothetical protein